MIYKRKLIGARGWQSYLGKQVSVNTESETGWLREQFNSWTSEQVNNRSNIWTDSQVCRQLQI